MGGIRSRVPYKSIEHGVVSSLTRHFLQFPVNPLEVWAHMSEWLAGKSMMACLHGSVTQGDAKSNVRECCVKGYSVSADPISGSNPVIESKIPNKF